MEFSVVLLLAVLTGLLLLLARGHPKAHGRLPPGPRPLAFLGNILQMDRSGLLKSFLRLREKYGDVFTVYLGPRPVVMLCGIEAIREALVDQAEAFSGRGRVSAVEQIFQGYGVVFANGERWKLLRRFSLATMKNFGMGKRSIEERIQEESQCVVEELRKTQGTHRQIYKNVQEIIAFIEDAVEKHRETLDPSTPRDFMDAYLIRMDKVGEKSDPNSEFHHRNLICTVLSLFFAGTETTSSTLRYGFQLMLKYPHVTERVHKEIDQVIGPHRLPSLDDRAKMPYTDAVIHEIQRFSDLFPIGAPHTVTKDTHFRGYFMPKGTEVYPLLHSALNDPHYFEKPDAFNPDHFLDANGALKKNEAFIPFSMGKRICLGEGIAHMELFLFFTTILQNFSVASPVAPEDIDLTPQENGIGRVPPVYQISFRSRRGD
ncbi:cytochrome P450 2B4-like isoform X3 [Panthera leo]|uniref:cytochrome P450 2B4-like isoform X3 n=1 Tax=Panthera leo TaxID=9689 RepID=UPI001C69BA5B|nr:cytochrome P450 2B4-like isoform X3 [Panthera leo]